VDLDEHQRAAAGQALDDLVRAPDDGAAWRAWRRLERGWDALHAADRVRLKADARRRLPGAVDGPRRLAVVEKLADR
jgi:hypothetical protein